MRRKFEMMRPAAVAGTKQTGWMGPMGPMGRMGPKGPKGRKGPKGCGCELRVGRSCELWVVSCGLRDATHEAGRILTSLGKSRRHCPLPAAHCSLPAAYCPPSASFSQLTTHNSQPFCRIIGPEPVRKPLVAWTSRPRFFSGLSYRLLAIALAAAFTVICTHSNVLAQGVESAEAATSATRILAQARGPADVPSGWREWIFSESAIANAAARMGMQSRAGGVEAYSEWSARQLLMGIEESSARVRDYNRKDQREAALERAESVRAMALRLAYLAARFQPPVPEDSLEEILRIEVLSEILLECRRGENQGRTSYFAMRARDEARNARAALGSDFLAFCGKSQALPR